MAAHNKAGTMEKSVLESALLDSSSETLWARGPLLALDQYRREAAAEMGHKPNACCARVKWIILNL